MIHLISFEKVIYSEICIVVLKCSFPLSIPALILSLSFPPIIALGVYVGRRTREQELMWPSHPTEIGKFKTP